MHRGYVKLWRKIEASRTWSRGANAVFTLVALVLRANYADGWWQGRTIRRGQLALSQEAFAATLGMSRGAFRRALEHLEFDGVILTTPANKYTLVTILNYETYQGHDRDERTTVDTADSTANDTAPRTPDDTTASQQPARNKKNKNKHTCVSRASARDGSVQPVDNSSRGGESGKELQRPTVAQVAEYALSHGRCVDAERFVAYWESAGWQRSGRRVSDWRPLVLTWRDDRNPALVRWQAQYDRAKRLVGEALERNSGAPERGEVTRIVVAVRSDLGSDMRPGDKYPNDGAWHGAKAALDGWKAASVSPSDAPAGGTEGGTA